MNDPAGQPSFRGGVWNFLSTVWPASTAADSELQRRKKIAVRSGQLAVVIMVALAVTGRITADKHQLPRLQAAGLVLAGLGYVIWYLYGLRAVVRWTLWERGAGPPRAWPPPFHWKQVFYFTIQFCLAGLICLLGGRGGDASLIWLVLLPSVAQGVFMLRWPGVVVVTGISMAMLTGVGWWQGWHSPSQSLLEFSYAALFTLVFATLAVSSEKARGEVERLAGELSAANQKLREYAVQAGELAATRERNRLAREIHDSLGHYLTVVNMQIEAARALQNHDPSRMKDALDKAQALTQQGLQDIRRSVTALRVSPLDDQSLMEALNQIVSESCAAGLKTELEVCGPTRALPPPVKLTLYRAGQEGLTNVRKHARATLARLTLDFRSPEKVCLRIMDDGAGSAIEATNTGGYGLLGLRERVQLSGGAVRVETSPGSGFTLEVEVSG